MTTYDLSFTGVNLPTNSGGASVTIEEDPDTDGTFENSDTVSLSDGTTRYTTSNVFNGSGDVRLGFSLGPPSDVTVTSAITFPVDVVTTVTVSESGSLTSTSLLTATEFASATEVPSLQSVAIPDTVERARATESGSLTSQSSLTANELRVAVESADIFASSTVTASELGLATESPSILSQTSFSTDLFASARETSLLQSSALFDVSDVGLATESSAIQSSSFTSATEFGRATESSTLQSTALFDVAAFDIYFTTTTSHSDTINTFAQSDRTSLELLDFDVRYDENEAAWYTDWFAEEKILGDEDELAIIAYIVPDAKEPAATVHLEYDSDGDEQPDIQSNPVRVGQQQDVKTFENVPVVDEGQYRLRISNYSGYNSLTTLNVGFVH